MQKLKNSKILAAAVLVVIILLIIFMYFNSHLDKNGLYKGAEGTDSGYGSSTGGSVNYENETLLPDKNIINILLVGRDGDPSVEYSRSDSIIIATVNKESGSIKLTSLMRDMYVKIPDYDYNKINSAYAFGGMELLAKTVEENFLIQIDGCIEADFAGFEKIIDRIGGVDVELNKDEVYYLNNACGLNLIEGKNNLTGNAALQYARIRYVGNDDYERTERQRRVLKSAFYKVKDLNMTELIKLGYEILPLINTNLANSQILELAAEIILMDVSCIETCRIPADGKFTEATIHGMSVLVPDLPENRTLLKEFIEN